MMATMDSISHSNLEESPSSSSNDDTPNSSPEDTGPMYIMTNNIPVGTAVPANKQGGYWNWSQSSSPSSSQPQSPMMMLKNEFETNSLIDSPVGSPNIKKRQQQAVGPSGLSGKDQPNSILMSNAMSSKETKPKKVKDENGSASPSPVSSPSLNGKPRLKRTSYACRRHRHMHKRCPLECPDRRGISSREEGKLQQSPSNSPVLSHQHKPKAASSLGGASAMKQALKPSKAPHEAEPVPSKTHQTRHQSLFTHNGTISSHPQQHPNTHNLIHPGILGNGQQQSQIHHHFPGHPQHCGLLAPSSTGATVHPGTQIVRVQTKNGQTPDQWVAVCWENLWDTFGADNYVPPADPAKDNWEDLKSPAHWEESKMKDGSREGSPLLGHLTKVFNSDSMTSLLENEEGFRINEFEVDSQGYLIDNDSDSSAGGDHVNSSSEHEHEEGLQNFWNNSYWGDANANLNGADGALFGNLMSGSSGNGEHRSRSPSLSLEEAAAVLTPQQGEEDFDSQQTSSPSSALGDVDPSVMPNSMGIEDNINHLNLNFNSGNNSPFTYNSSFSSGTSPNSSLDLSSPTSAPPSQSSSSLTTPTSPPPDSPFSVDKEGGDSLKGTLFKLLLTRDTVGRWLEDPFFDQLVRGCYVRALVGSSLRNSGSVNGMPNPVYRIARIVEVQNNCYPSYTLEPHQNLHPTRKGIMLQMGGTLRMVSLQAISNKLPSEQEYREWQDDLDKMNGATGLSPQEIQEKLELFRLLDLKYPSSSKYGTSNVVDSGMNKLPSPIKMESYSF